MTLESVTYIEDLDEDYPAEGETGTLHEGNDHIRNIKKAVKNSWALAAKLAPTTSQVFTVPTTGPWAILRYSFGYTGNVWEVQNSSSQIVARQDAYNGAIYLNAYHSSVYSSYFMVIAAPEGGDSSSATDYAYLGASVVNGSILRIGRPSSGFGSANAIEYKESAGNTVLAYISNAGEVGGQGSFASLSDLRDKAEVANCAAGLNEILALRPVTFEYIKQPGVVNYGFIAQEVQAVLPHAVSQFSDSDKLALAYTQILAPLVKAVQELAVRIKELEG